MKIDLDYSSFCDIYYKDAEEVADITIAEHIKKHGQLNPYIDVDVVKDLGISYGLEKVCLSQSYSSIDEAGVERIVARIHCNYLGSLVGDVRVVSLDKVVQSVLCIECRVLFCVLCLPVAFGGDFLICRR